MSEKLTEDEARSIIDHLRQDASHLPEMSMEEIDAEIAKVRTERKGQRKPDRHPCRNA